jgi:hypothetical protein
MRQAWEVEMSLKNSFHTQLAMGILISDEKELESQLALLTEIGLTASNEETFKICEDFRERLCREQVETGRSNNVPRIYKARAKRSPGNEVSDSNNGEQ